MYEMVLTKICSIVDSLRITNKRISAHERAVSADCVLSFTAEVKETKDTKIVPCKWYSEVKYKVSCKGVKSR